MAADEITRDAEVSWDFRTQPDQTSNFYVGSRTIRVGYSSSECASRFTLEEVRYEFAKVDKDGESVPGGPPFLMLTFRKHFAGDFELFPRVTITQNEANKKGKPTGRKRKVEFPFRKKKMAAPVADWTAKEIDLHVGAPGAVMDLHNPFDWSSIEIRCD